MLKKNKELSSTVLYQFIQKIHPLTDEEWNDFETGWKPFACKRKTLLTSPGETERYLYFVLEGVQRAYYIGKNDQEATIVFTYAPSFSGVADSLLTQTASEVYLETLTHSQFLRIPYAQIIALMQQYHNIQTLIFKATAFALKGVLHRQIEIQCFDASEKFNALMSRSPHLFQLIPHKYLASYLGIDPSTFSKLLSTLKQ